MDTPKTGEKCGCKVGVQRDNCPRCEGTGEVIDFAAIRAKRKVSLDPLRAVKFDGYTLETWTTGKYDRRGQSEIAYRLTHPSGWVIFDARDFHGSPLHADDSDETMRALIGFLTLRPGDTDAEYFAGYTARQLEWAEAEAEYLSLWSMSPEDGGPEGFEELDEN
jgi:hypothetical protein